MSQSRLYLLQRLKPFTNKIYGLSYLFCLFRNPNRSVKRRSPGRGEVSTANRLFTRVRNGRKRSTPRPVRNRKNRSVADAGKHVQLRKRGLREVRGEERLSNVNSKKRPRTPYYLTDLRRTEGEGVGESRSVVGYGSPDGSREQPVSKREKR